MPLKLGDASTERAQIISFDDGCPIEVEEASERCLQLLARGFTVRHRITGQITLDAPVRDPNLGTFRILSQNGDDRVVWDRREPEQVREAFRQFKDFIAASYTAYATTLGGRRGHRIDDFDPGLEEILLVPSTVPG